MRLIPVIGAITLQDQCNASLKIWRSWGTNCICSPSTSVTFIFFVWLDVLIQGHELLRLALPRLTVEASQFMGEGNGCRKRVDTTVVEANYDDIKKKGKEDREGSWHPTNVWHSPFFSHGCNYIHVWMSWCSVACVRSKLFKDRRTNQDAIWGDSGGPRDPVREW